MAVYEAFGANTNLGSDLNVPVSGLYLLATPSTPDFATAEIIERVELLRAS